MTTVIDIPQASCLMSQASGGQFSISARQNPESQCREPKFGYGPDCDNVSSRSS